MAIDQEPLGAVKQKARGVTDDFAGIIQAGHERGIGRSIAKGKELERAGG